MKIFALGFGALILSALATPSLAVPVAAPGTEGRSIYATGGTVTATYLGSSAAFRNQLYFDGSLLFDNKVDSAGNTVDLGLFDAGTELTFRLFVETTNTSFYTGAPTRNPDDRAHARIEDDWTRDGTTLASFEDLASESPDYNDVSFSFANTTTSPGVRISSTKIAPVPLLSTAPLLTGALGGLWLFRRRGGDARQFRAS